MWHVALESWQWIHHVATPCNVIRSSGMTCHWISPNVRHIGILHLVSISTTSPQSTCHSAPVSDILSKSDHTRQKNDDISIFRMANMSHLGFQGSNNRFFRKPSYNLLNYLVFQKIAFLHFGINIQDGGSQPSWILRVPWWVLWQANVRLPIRRKWTP